MFRIFIDRPVLASVFSIVILLLGGISAGLLSVAEYPEVTPPMVRVTAYFPGANAQVVADTVAAPIEQQVNGVEKMLYMTSQSNNDGSYTLDVTFEIGTNTNMAQVLVQNRVAIAEPSLPDVVRAIGVTTKKRAADILLAISLDSENDPGGRPLYNALYMSNFATIQLKDAISRLEGVGDVFIMGQQDYSMRVWLDPDKLSSRNLTVTEVIKVLREQNVQVAAGQIGQRPASNGQAFQYTLSTLGRLVEPEQFANIILNTDKNGEITYLKDVSRTELGAKSEDLMSRLDRLPSSGLACYLLPGANALDTADAIKAKMRELKKRFPAGLKYAIVYDTTPFVRESVNEVKKTLLDAIILVTIVILVFLQDWKSLLLPVIGVLVSLVGTFAVMAMMGFTLNNLTLFGLVLAIGIVVDDAIVVLENIERWMEKGLPAREATMKAMEEITGPIVAITLVLSSVLLPSTALTGLVGQFFRQFAVTISVSMLISAVNAMTMTPALAVLFFRNRKPGNHPEDKEALPWWSFILFGGLLSVWLLTPILGPLLGLHVGEDHGEAESGGIAEFGATLVLALPGAIAGGVLGWFFARTANWLLGFFFRGFNRFFAWATRVYGRVIGWSLRFSAIVLLVYVGLIGLTGFGFTRIPTGFIPMQDKGYLVTNIVLPDSASMERTLEVTDAVEKIALETPGVAHTLCLPGMSYVLNANSSNYSNVFIIFKPFHDRRDPELSGDAIAARIRERVEREVLEAHVLVFGAPPISGLGTSAGFKLMVEAIGDVNFDKLQTQADELAVKGNQQPNLVGLFNGFRAHTPQLYIDIDREKVKSMGVSLRDVFDTLQACVGQYYVNDFNRFGRTWQVNLQADTRFRMDAEKVKQFKVRNADGDMVPLGSVARVYHSSGPVQITRYNTRPSASINGLPLPGTSTGDALATMEKLSESLPHNMATEWTEVSFLQKRASKIEQFRDLLNIPVSAFVVGVVLVFFVLAGLYESWSLPWSVILVVPMCLLSALVGLALAGYDVNIFVQVGFVVLVGLAAKNAILIVQFARDREAEGVSLHDAAEEAARERLRPILMTSFAFILGVFPLVIAEGAGHEMRRTLGMAVFAGMIGVTLFGLFLTPVFYYVVRSLVRRRTPADEPAAAAADGPPRATPVSRSSDHAASGVGS